MRKIWIIAAIIIFLAGSIVLFSPALIKNYFNKNSKELTGRKASIEKLNFNPFNAAVTILDFKYYEADDSAVFVSLDSIYVNINFSKLIFGGFELEEIRLVNPLINIIQFGENFNFDDLLEEDTTSQTEDSGNTEFVLKEIHLFNGKMTYFDKNVDNKINFDRLNLYLPIIAWNSESANMGIDLQINKTGRLQISNNYFPARNSFDSHIQLSGMDISFAYPYLKPYLIIDSIGGKLNCNINVLAEFSDTNSIVISGSSHLTNFIITDSSFIPLMSIDSVDFQIDKVDLLNNSYKLRKLFIDKPFFRFDLLSDTGRLFNMLAATENSNEPEDDSTSPELFYSIDTLILANGSLKYRDYTLAEYYEYNITDIISQSNNLSSTAEELTLSAGGLINNHGNFAALLTVYPQKEMDFSIEFQVDGFQMVDFSPLAIYYAGYPVFEGVMIYSGKTIIKDYELNSQNKIAIYNLQLGDKIEKKVLYAFPLKFAIFLLKDKNGVVKLDLPIGGNMNDPKFKMGRIIWQIIKQNAEKVVAAPGKALASQYGFNEEEIRFIEFEPDEIRLNPMSTNTLDNLIQIATDKSELAIGLKYYDNPFRDRALISLKQCKILYVQENLNTENNQQARVLAANLSSSDKMFLNFMKNNTKLNTENVDSLAMEMIDDEQFLQIITNYKTERETNIIQYISSKNDAISGQFKFVEDTEMPTFLIEKPGFEVKFNLIDENK